MPMVQTFSQPLSNRLRDTPSTRPHPNGVSPEVAARCEWLTTAAAFADTGGLVSGDELAEMLREQSLLHAQTLASQPVSMVARWIVSRAALTLDSPSGTVLPLFQFDLPRASLHPAMEVVLAELQGVMDGAELALWFVTPNEWLQGQQPVQAMQTSLQAVRNAARADRYVALGG